MIYERDCREKQSRFFYFFIEKEIFFALKTD